MKKILIVAQDSAKKLFSNWGWRLMVLLPIVAIFALIIYRNQSSDVEKIGISSSNVTLVKQFEKQSTKDLRFYKVDSKHVKHNKTYLDVSLNGAQVIVKQKGQKLSDDQQTQVRTIAENVQSNVSVSLSGMTAKQLSIIGTKPKIVFNNKSDSSNVLVMVFPIVVYFLTIMYASIFSTDLGSDKATKTLDIYLSSMRQNDFFLGKILGLASMVILNVVSLIVAAIVGMQLLNSSDTKAVKSFIKSSLHSISNANLTSLLIMTICSFLIFSMIAAILGARSKDSLAASRAATPIIIFAMLLYFAATMVPAGRLPYLLSFVPAAGVFFVPAGLQYGGVNSLWWWTLSIENLVTVVLVYRLVVYSYVKSYKR